MKNKSGIDLIAKERQEQLIKHKRSIKADVELNKNGQLIDAVTQLINVDNQSGSLSKTLSRLGGTTIIGFNTPVNWDKKIFGKMIGKSYKERLIISGALIAAEIDRLNNSKQVN